MSPRRFNAEFSHQINHEFTSGNWLIPKSIIQQFLPNIAPIHFQKTNFCFHERKSWNETRFISLPKSDEKRLLRLNLSAMHSDAIVQKNQEPISQVIVFEGWKWKLMSGSPAQRDQSSLLFWTFWVGSKMWPANFGINKHSSCCTWFSLSFMFSLSWLMGYPKIEINRDVKGKWEKLRQNGFFHIQETLNKTQQSSQCQVSIPIRLNSDDKAMSLVDSRSQFTTLMTWKAKVK